MRTASFALAAMLVAAEGAPQVSADRPYSRIEILPVWVPYGIVVDGEFRQALTRNLVTELQKANVVDAVVEADGLEASPNTLRLATTIVRFNAGDRDVRAGIGLGFGATRMKVRAQLLDARSCAVVADGEADGRVIGGWLGGDSLNATRGVAKDVVKIVARARLNTRVNANSSCDPDDRTSVILPAAPPPSTQMMELLAAADRGDSEAQRELASRYIQGDGVVKSEALGVKWWKRAAEGGDAAAQAELGVRYEMGWGLPIDPAASLTWTQKSAAQQYPDGLALLGVRYERGAGVPQSASEAARLYRAAAEQGHARAMCYLGDMYLWGQGVENSASDAHRWHIAAVAAGDQRCGTNAKNSSTKLSRDARQIAEREGRELARRHGR